MSLNFRSAQNFYKPEIVRVQNCFMCIVIPNLWFIIKVSPVVYTRHMLTSEVFTLFFQFLRATASFVTGKYADLSDILKLGWLPVKNDMN